eukprot:Lithocolla_globosa_v1_NODE_4233_length_1482_cov_20.973371.p1 type:complete len:269 gc:universal NODE_4233_length_1482_cov_20.973371:245-1051(+)
MALIQQIQLYTKEGLYLADIRRCNEYMHAISRRSTPLDEMLTNDIPLGGAVPSGYIEGLYRSNSAVNAVGAVRYSNGDARNAYTEPSYLLAGALNSGVAPQMNFQFPLKRFIDSALALDLNQYFGESVYLRIIWAPATDTFFRSPSAVDPTAADGGINKTFGGTITISGLTLYTAIEQNPVVSQSIMDKFKSGSLTYQVPFVHMNINTLTNTTQNVQVRYSRPMGQKLKKIYWCTFDSRGNNLRYDTTNVAAVKLSDFHVLVNGTRMI